LVVAALEVSAGKTCLHIPIVVNFHVFVTLL